MKKLVVLLSLIASSSAFAAGESCTREDAQVVGTVVAIQETDGDLCVAQLSFAGRNNMFNAAYGCPLDKHEVQSQGVLLECGPVVGSQVDGILYRTSPNGPILLY
ncbi:hypothetical protein [Bdellovibrio sp. HCB209]|uniref:hypothetical protein n=1 Tax=Bdellovibrio sp. HCB209 TaxID=3394354 RepID=UPI0039B3A2EE